MFTSGPNVCCIITVSETETYPKTKVFSVNWDSELESVNEFFFFSIIGKHVAKINLYDCILKIAFKF